MLKKKFSNLDLKLNFKQSSWSFPCFYCNADSNELKYFLILFIGGLCISAVLFGFGLILRGNFKKTEDLADLPLRIKKEDEQSEF